MTKENNSQQEVVVIKESSNLVGILSAVFGFISIFMLSIIFVPLAIGFGIYAIKKGQLILGILGLIFAFIGTITSPVLIAFFVAIIELIF